LSEVLTGVIKEEAANKELYQYLEASFIWLDTHDSVSNFHLLFLMNLTKFLGFYPDTSHKHLKGFNLIEGSFTESLYEKGIVKNEELTQLKKLLGIHFDGVERVLFNKQQRQQVLGLILHYFELHLDGFKKPKSLSVLETIFS